MPRRKPTENERMLARLVREAVPTLWSEHECARIAAFLASLWPQYMLPELRRLARAPR